MSENLKEENIIKDEEKVKKDRKGFAIVTFILGVASIITLICGVEITLFIGIPCAILGIICGVISVVKNKDWARIISLVGIILILIYFIFFINIIGSQSSFVVDKPIIYLYPEKETEISVELKNSEQLTVSYPRYIDGWKVLAKENGDLIDLETGRNLYSLYYESENVINFKVEKEGFVIKREDSAEFLEEKLEILGLTEREAEEFIIYWLPKLEENEYNYIRFASEEEIEENMPLKITPEPDTVIRVMMTFKGLEKPIEVEEQKLETPERTGFVAVEWGGTEIN